MSPSAPRRRGRPRNAASEEEREARERALQEARFIKHCHYQPHPPVVPSTTDPIVGPLHSELHVQLPTPLEDPPAAEPTYNRNDDDEQPNEAEAGSVGAVCNPPLVGDAGLDDTPFQYDPAEEERSQHGQEIQVLLQSVEKAFASQYHQSKVPIDTLSRLLKWYPKSQL
ncbi:hypothetical protein BGZ63DRAFT_429551 [Mariannaea sp. PMI_226]|nr:hypothetical protein BGZ63DRAFT_429551 [Mariannaea sp. PMI_226]